MTTATTLTATTPTPTPYPTAIFATAETTTERVRTNVHAHGKLMEEFAHLTYESRMELAELLAGSSEYKFTQTPTGFIFAD